MHCFLVTFCEESLFIEHVYGLEVGDFIDGGDIILALMELTSLLYLIDFTLTYLIFTIY